MTKTDLLHLPHLSVQKVHEDEQGCLVEAINKLPPVRCIQCHATGIRKFGSRLIDILLAEGVGDNQIYVSKEEDCSSISNGDRHPSEVRFSYQ